MSWLQFGHHAVNFFYLLGVSVPVRPLKGCGSGLSVDLVLPVCAQSVSSVQFISVAGMNHLPFEFQVLWMELWDKWNLRQGRRMEAREQDTVLWRLHLFYRISRSRSSIMWPPSSSLVSPGLPITSEQGLSSWLCTTLLTTC